MGHYVLSTLTPGEYIACEAKTHWIAFFSTRALCTLFLGPLIDSWTTELVLTNKRVVAKSGLIRRKTMELNLVKVESVQIQQSILGRILGYGTVVLIGTGGTRETINNIGQPLAFRRTFQIHAI